MSESSPIVLIAVISDLHLGPKDRTDVFGHRADDFLRFLRFLESGFDRIVLLGDIWETLTHRRFGRERESLSAAREAHWVLARRFEGPKYRYVHGNHDLVTASTEDAPEELVLDSDGMRVLFTHGHQHDLLVRHARRWTEFNVWVGGWIQRLGGQAVHRMASRLDELRLRTARDPLECSFQTWAVRRAKRRGADVVVTGHTHHLTRGEHGTHVFLNSGSCAEGRFAYAAVDTRRGECTVHEGF
jgi:predicted phosphodiesterase